MPTYVNGRQVSRYSTVDRDRQNQNGLSIPNTAVYVRSGTIENVVGGLTGSTTLNFDVLGFKIKRFQIFHSGAASSTNVTLDNRSPNISASFDPRSVVVKYNNIAGSNNFSTGIDQLEDLVALTDSGGSLYLNVSPQGTGFNTYKYLIFFEAVMIYVNQDSTL